MNKPDVSIIIPHKRTRLNDEALMLNMCCMLQWTDCNFELIIETTEPKDPYQIWNEAAPRAAADILVFSNSDVIFGPDWDLRMLIACKDNTIVTGYLVEPGNIGVAEQNIHLDFGRSPESFKEDAFRDYVYRVTPDDIVIMQERGWYMPCAVRKDWFISTGGFPTELPFPNPNDILYWNFCVNTLGTKLLRVHSYAYHFQNLSGRA